MSRDFNDLTEWSAADRAALNDLIAAEANLPADAPRALLSVRLSVFTDETTSPVRQELDLRRLALEKGYRVMGVASDLNVSATKVPPWKRPELGKWLVDRVPEFDAILFWKLDRFVRNMNDLAQMIQWAERFQKNLISKYEQIDLESIVGKIMVTIIGGVAEIEAANTKVRVESLWEHTKTQTDWNIGKPPFGYDVVRDGNKNRLAINEKEAHALRVARRMAMLGISTRQIVLYLHGRNLITSRSIATMTRRMRNPATLGYRVEERHDGGFRKSQLVYGPNGEPIIVGPAIFTQQEWDDMQAALDKRMIGQPARNAGGATKFLGVLVCADCGGNMTVKNYTKQPGEKNRLKEAKSYAYLRCQECPGGGQGAPHPQAIYEAVVDRVLALMGDIAVQVREYAKGDEARQRLQELESRIAYYMEGLEPGGRFAKTEFTRLKAERAQDALIAELESINADETVDRWVYTDKGKTFREHWEEGGMDAMAADLRRVGAEVVVKRIKIEGQRAPEIALNLRLPTDYEQRLVVKPDEFAAQQF